MLIAYTGDAVLSNVKLLTKSAAQTKIVGDINSDGKFNVADAVLLQKWLLAVPNTVLADWKAGNFNDDDRLDALDLSLMKRALLAERANHIRDASGREDDFKHFV